MHYMILHSFQLKIDFLNDFFEMSFFKLYENMTLCHLKNVNSVILMKNYGVSLYDVMKSGYPNPTGLDLPLYVALKRD